MVEVVARSRTNKNNGREAGTGNREPGLPRYGGATYF